MTGGKGGKVNLTTERMEGIHQICREYRVERLYLFGSAAVGESRSDSDIDFLVEFQDSENEQSHSGGFGGPCAGMAVRLEGLFGREADVVERRRIGDPIMLQDIDRTKALIYDAGNQSLKYVSSPRPRPRSRQAKEKILNRRTQKFLHDIHQSAQMISRYSADKTEEDYLADVELRDKIERRMIGVCESMRKLDRLNPQTASRFTDHIKIIGFRTFLIHRYDYVDHKKVWGYVKNDVPTLITEAEEMLDEFGWPSE